ncbi:hypothetical protein [Paenibacillus kandeliae]|uniref:hypothetical protein n=1 Tax=Paenibacillus kandeliae TaxID=3231269 RepID=UPI003457CFBD
MYLLRIDTLADDNVAQQYFDEIWQKHLESLPRFGIIVHCIFKAIHEPKVVALVSYAENIDPQQSEVDYMESSELHYDMGTIDMNVVLGVDALMLEEATYFPLRK